MRGTLHPTTSYLRQCIKIFKNLGFEVVDSPEVVSEKHNFDDLRIPPNHPARDMQDTFWLINNSSTNRRLPRTQTSAHQIPAMQTRKPPVRLIIPGKVFRNEATDANHETTFYQLEGFVIDDYTSLAHLKGTIINFLKELYGPNVEVKFKSAYFPFVEPGIEVFVKSKRGWLEMMGAGMIHPEVLQNMGVDPNKYQGFAFGMGIDRLVAIKYGIEDIRHLWSGNLRFLLQF